MSGDPWITTITRPTSHLLSTIAVFGVLSASVVLSVVHPQLMAVFGVVGSLPAVTWYVFMMRRYRARKADWRAEQA